MESITQRMNLSRFPRSFREELVRQLGYGVNDGLIIHSDGTVYTDPFTRAQVHIDRMILAPGSVLILDDNPVSLICYMHRYGRSLEEIAGPA